LTGTGSIAWISEISQLNCVAAIELTSQLRPDRADDRSSLKRPIAFADIPKSTGDVLLGIIDHGCPFVHEYLKDSNGNSRFLSLWDQDENPDFDGCGGIPVGLGYGRQILRSHFHGWAENSTNSITGVNEDDCYAAAKYPALRSRLTHGAMTAGHFAGSKISRSVAQNPELPESKKSNPALSSDVVFIQLPRRGLLSPSTGATNRSILDGLRYLLCCANDKTKRIVACIPYGNIQGPHDGSSMIERAMDAIVAQAERVGVTLQIVFPSGNTFNKPVLAKVMLDKKCATAELGWSVPPDAETLLGAEIWLDNKQLPDVIEIQPPSAAQALSLRFSKDYDKCELIRAQEQVIGVVVVKKHEKNTLVYIQWIAPTLKLKGALTFSQRWRIRFTTDQTLEKPLYCYLGWGGENLGFGQRVRASRWIALTENIAIAGDGSMLGTACGESTYMVGAKEKWGRNKPTLYSGGGRPRGGNKLGVDFLAIAEESVWFPGIVCLGTRSGITARLSGTSVAAPQAARLFAVTDQLGHARQNLLAQIGAF
jgi:hypothetical protein